MQENLWKTSEDELQVNSVKRTCGRVEVPRKVDWNVPLQVWISMGFAGTNSVSRSGPVRFLTLKGPQPQPQPVLIGLHWSKNWTGPV